MERLIWTVTNSKKKRVLLILCGIILLVFFILFINWRIYIHSIPEKEIYFEDSFEDEISDWKCLDAKWKEEYLDHKGVVEVSRDYYAAPYCMKYLQNKTLYEEFICHFTVCPNGFTNDATVLATLILPTDSISVTVNNNGEFGIARELFQKPTYGNKHFNLKETKWYDIYVYVNTTKNKIILTVNNVEILQKEFTGEPYPIQEIWLGAIWLHGGGNYGAPIHVYYDNITIGNRGILPKLSFMEYTLNEIQKIFSGEVTP